MVVLYRGYEGGGDIPSDYFDFQTVQYNNGGSIKGTKVVRFYYDVYNNYNRYKNQDNSKLKGDYKLALEKALEKAEKDKNDGTYELFIGKIPSKLNFDNGGRVEYFDREDFYNKNPRLPRRIEISKSQYIKNKDFISKQKWARNIVDTQGYEDNNGVEFIEFDIEVNEKSSWDMWGWINENIPSSERKIFVQDKRFLEYSEGGDIPSDYFDFQTVQYNNGGTIEDITTEFFKRRFDRKPESDPSYYETWKNRIAGAIYFNDYSDNMDNESISTLKEIIAEQPNNKKLALGGLLLAGGFGAYVGYKIGRARPQKKGFDTEKKIAQKVKQGVKDVTKKEKPAKAYKDGGGVSGEKKANNKESILVAEYLDRLEDYHGEDVSWYIENNSDSATLRDELINLGDDEFIQQAKFEGGGEIKSGDFVKKKGSNLELKVVEVGNDWRSGKDFIKIYNDVTNQTKTLAN